MPLEPRDDLPERATSPMVPEPISTADHVRVEGLGGPGDPGEIVFQGYSQERVHYGPLPDGETLAELNRAYPDAAKEIFAEYRAQSAHRREMEKLVVQTNSRLAILGQRFGAWIGSLGLLVSGFAAYTNHPATAVAIASGCLASLVSVFVIGRRGEEKEREKKAEIQARIEKGEPLASVEGDGGGHPED